MKPETPHDPLIDAILKLWTSSFHGLLSTHSVKFPGYPFGSLLPVCRDSKGNPLLLISHLAQHTRNLEADPHCSLTLSETDEEDIQQSGRLTCLARAEALNSNASAERYFRYYPETRRYYKEMNFRFYHLILQQHYFIGGFGSARWFDASRVPPPAPFAAAEEAELLFQLNAKGQNLLRRYLHQREIPANAVLIEAVGIDPLGLDIRMEHKLQRLTFPQGLSSSADFLSQIRDL
ncbi:MAG: pyridoxamine 5'-phosphate oxidase family protein [Candidatus Thiodiazotropha sp.]